jgi:type II secretory pathway pseudopilin PulG
MLKKIFRKQQGFTMLEMLIAFAITLILVPAIIAFSRTALANNAKVQNQATELNQLKNAFNYISQDVQMAGKITVANPATDSHFPLTLSWINYPTDLITVVYSIVDGNLQRDYTDSETPSNNKILIVASNVNLNAAQTYCTWGSDNPGVDASTLTVNLTITIDAESEVRQFTITPRVIQSALTQIPTTLTLGVSPSSAGYGTLITMTAAVFPSVASGDVTFLDGGSSIGTSAIMANGQATYTVTSLIVGSHSLTAVYSGDTNYNQSTSADRSLTITQATPAIMLASSANPSTIGQSVTFTATVTPNEATGTVTFKNGATQLGSPVALSSGIATYATGGSDLPLGNNAITAVYSGDSNDNPGTSSALTQVVNQTITTVVLTSSLNPSISGDAVTFTAAVTPGTATGVVTFKDSSTTLGTGTLSSGAATYTTSALAAASHSLTAVYAGDVNDYGCTSSTLTQTVNKITTSVILASSSNPSTYGGSVTFTATMTPGSATGTVTFKDGGTTLGTGTLSTGTATYSIASLTAGSHAITAVYGGDANCNASTSSTLTQTVNKTATSVVLASNSNPSAYGGSVIFTATMTPGGATGTVTFKDGGTTLGTGTLGSGTATYTTSALAAGSHAITAVYGGDANCNASTSSTLTQTVNKAATSVALASNSNPSAYGGSVTFTATMTPGGATGTVTFKDGGTTLGTGTLGSGTATYTTSALAAGSHAITAVYGGDANCNASTSSTLTQTVNVVLTNIGQNSSTTTGTTISVTVPAGGVAAGNTIIVSFATDPTNTPTGAVTVADTKGNTYTKDADIANGTGTSGVRTVVFSAPVTTALVSGNTITVTYPSAAAKAVSVCYANGLISASRVDVTHTGTGNNTDPTSGATAATTQASELLFGAIGTESRISSTTMTAGSGYTLLNDASADTGSSGSSITIFPEYQPVYATGTYTANGTLSGSTSRNWAAVIVTYKTQ